MRTFRGALEGGHQAERKWVDMIRQSGLSVAHGKKLLITRHDKNTDHVESPDAVALISLEIKERSLKFTGPGDYPYDTVIVDDLRGLEREKLKHMCYIYLSRPTGSWVWLSALDRDESWTTASTFARGRQHYVPCLYAPKKCLRPAADLMYYLYPHSHLDLVDGDTTCFVTGGGEAEVRERYAPKPH